MSRKYDLFTHEKIKKIFKTLKLTLIKFYDFTNLSKIKKQVNLSKWLTLNIIQLKLATSPIHLRTRSLNAHIKHVIYFQPKNSKPIFFLPLFI
jgi:hypothetical protein